MWYVVYFNCPNCKKPCGSDPLETANEVLYANSESEARKIFNSLKPCKQMKVTEVKKLQNGIVWISEKPW